MPDNKKNLMDQAFAALLSDDDAKVLGAIVLWIVGRFLIGMIRRLIDASLVRQSIDATLVRYIDSALGILLNVVLVIAVLSVFGVETTTFAGLLAAAGVAIGMAWSGLLANFAAGVFMVVLRPIKVGDYVTAAGVTGTVETLGLFVTALNTPDNVKTYVGNNAIFSGTIQNFSANPHRRVELLCQLDGSADHLAAIAQLKAGLAKIPNVKATPAPEVDILQFNLVGPVLSVRPYAHTDHYWQVYFDSNELIKQVSANFPAPTPVQKEIQIRG